MDALKPACVMRWAVVVSVAVLPACATLDKIDKATNPPGSEAARMTERLKKRSEPVSTGTSSSLLRAIPPVVDFGNIQVASDNQQQVKIFNPHEFAVTVVHVTVQGCGFALLAGGDQRHEVAARSELILGVIFRPVERRACSGALLLEIDSAAGRHTRVPLLGTGT